MAVAFCEKFHVLTPFLADVAAGGGGAVLGAAAGSALGEPGAADGSAEASIDGCSSTTSSPARSEPGEDSGEGRKTMTPTPISNTRHTPAAAASHMRRRSAGLR